MSYEQRLRAERWLAWVRAGAVPFAVFQTVITHGYPHGRLAWTWATTAALGVGALAFWWLVQQEPPARRLARIGFAALAFDTAIVSSFSLSLTFVRATPIRQVLILVLIEAAFRYGSLVNWQVQYVRRRDALPMTRDYLFEEEERLRTAEPPPQWHLAAE